MALERTFSIIKPDATRRNLTGKIIAKIEDAGLRVIASKRIKLSRAQAEGYCRDDDPRLLAEAIVAMFNQFCYIQLGGARAVEPDDRACIQTLANVYYRAIYG